VATKRVGRPTQVDTLRKSEAVLDFATDLFVARGFNGTTMEAVALAADIGKQALYQRYPDKESLFTAVIERLRDDAVFEHPRPDPGLPAAEGLRLWVAAILTDCARPKSLVICKLTMREGHRFPLLPPLLIAATVERFIAPLASYLDHLRRKGEIRQIDTFAAASMCADLIFAEITRAMFAEAEPSTRDIARAADRIADLVFKGMAPANAPNSRHALD
jgi:AcrR family transcriptional regulator